MSAFATGMFHVDLRQVREKLGSGKTDGRHHTTTRGEGQDKEMILTLLRLWSDGFPSKLELTTVADDDRGPRSVFLVCRNVHNLRDDVFISTDHPTEHHVFPCEKRRGVNQT